MKKMAIVIMSCMVFGAASLIAMNQENKNNDEKKDEIISSITTNSEDGENNENKNNIEEKKEEKKQNILLAKLNLHLEKQEYLSISNILGKGIYGGSKKSPLLVEWLCSKAQQCHVPLEYAYFRYLMECTKSITLDVLQFEYIARWIVLSIVFALADYQACVSVPHPKLQCDDPVTLLLTNYRHRLIKTGYLDLLGSIDCDSADYPSLAFEKIVLAAEKIFRQTIDKEGCYALLPSPFWELFVGNDAWVSEWITFNDLPDDSYLTQYKDEFLLKKITTERKKTYTFVWEYLKTIKQWTVFFNGNKKNISFTKNYTDFVKEKEKK